MRIVVAVLFALVVALPALADDPAPYVRACSTSQFGDLGRGWRGRALVAGHVAFVGMRSGYRRIETERLGPGRAMPLKVVVVVDPNAAPTVTIAPRSRAHAALGYNSIRQDGTQFGGYFLVAGARCVHIDVATRGKVLRRKLSFGARCA